jgi:hypothetical protein
MKQAGISALVAGCVWLFGCTGELSGNGPEGPAGPAAGTNGASGSSTGGGAGTEPTSGTGGGSGGTINTEPDKPVEPWEKVSTRAYLRKVKNILTGLAPTEAEIQSVVSVEADPAAAQNALRTLIDTWADPATPNFREKMIAHFRNVFQQKGFTPTEDFKPQLLENAGFDLGPVGLYGDDAFPKLVQNLQDSFARTALEILAQGRPFTEVLTTRQYMMTTALMSLYIQVEMPNDQPFAGGRGMGTDTRLAWSVDMTGVGTNMDPTDADRVSPAHPIEDVVNPASASYMIFDDRPPAMPGGTFRFGMGCMPEVKAERGYSLLFQRLFGFTPRTPYSGNIICGEHGALPYYTAEDLSDWRMVTITDGVNHPEMFDLPALRAATSLGLGMQRVSFFTTPAYLALWATNDSNQHRVTANQTLLIALGQSVMGSNDIVPVSTVGLDPEHAVANTECYACHTILDPLRQFWANQYDFNDRNDFPARVFNGIANPRPATTGGVLAFSNVNTTGANIADLGTLLMQVTDTNIALPDTAPERTVNRFALAMAQQLCFFADSAGCSEADPEFRRVVLAFQNDNYNYRTLLREMLSSPLVTGAANTLTFAQRNVVVSVSRRDQLCQALSNRLGVADICALGVAFPFQQGFGGTGTATALTNQRAIFRLAGAMPADAFSRGSESPVTSPEPTLFYRAASELVCETVATQVVDVTGSRYQSADLEGAMADMVQNVMGYATGDPHYAEALAILHDNYNESVADGRSATDSLRNTFALACQSPTSVSFGI